MSMSEHSEVDAGSQVISQNGTARTDTLETKGTENVCNFDQEIYDALFEAGYSKEEIAALSMDMESDSVVSEEQNDELLGEESDSDSEGNASDILQKVRIKNVNRIVIGSLNINSLPNKFDELKEVIGRNLDILTIQETKLDSSFPLQQFVIEGYSAPYKLDKIEMGVGF